MKKQSETPCIIDGIQLTPEFNFLELMDQVDDYYHYCITKHECCHLGSVKAVSTTSGNTLFICPKGCACHD